MQIVIPMAGSGKRFVDAGYKTPKPLIEVDGKPIIEHVINLFPGENEFLFICSQTLLKQFPIEKIIYKIKPSAAIVGIASHKLGPVETVLRAREFIKDTDPTIINYCDFFMDWNYKKFKLKVLKEKIDGAIVCYKGFHPHLLRNDFYASVKTDADNTFIETKEKFSYTPNKMDSWQSAGTYYFKSGIIAKKYLQQVKKEKLLTNGEYYIPWAYNLMQKDGLKTVVFPAEFFCQWGTPEHLREYLYWSRHFRFRR